MTLYLASEEGYVGDLASTSGYAELQRFLEQAAHAPLCNEFAEQGFTRNPRGMAEELDRLLAGSTVAGQDLRDTVVNLRDMLSKCDLVAIASDGVR